MKILEAYREQIKWRKKQLLTVAILFLLYFSLQDPITELFNHYIVEIILSKFSDEPFGVFRIVVYCGLFIAAGWLLIIKCIKQSYQPSLVLHFIAVFICVLYWRERPHELHYRLYPLLSIGNFTICQTDAFFVLLSLASVAVLFNYSVNRHFQPGNTFLKQDYPLEKIDGDLIGRKAFYKDIIDRISEVGFDTGRSFAIGINSVWGYGKTSLLNIIKEGLDKEKHSVSLYYNPWLTANKKSLTYDLFSVLEKQLSKHVSNTGILMDYARRVSKVDNDENKLKGITDFFNDEETLRERFDEITELIRITGKKFIVIIDDLDRLDNDEVFEILRLIRNVANFPRLVYIVAYDKYYLINALKSKSIFKPQQYLEKIFELEIELPKIDNLKLKQMCSNLLKNGLGGIEMLPAEKLVLETQLNELVFNNAALTGGKQFQAAKQFNNVFKSVRDILKFTNSFLLTLSLNKDELYLPDLYLIELIKVVNSDLYHLLASTDKYLTITVTGTNQIYTLYMAPSPLPIPPPEEFEIGTRVKHVYQLDLIKALFTFPSASDLRYDKAITQIDNFKTYFIFAEPQGVMAFDEIDKLLRS